MIRRPTWILLSVFVLLAAAAWFLEFSPNHPELGQKATVTPTLVSKLLEETPLEDIQQVSIEANQGESIKLRRNPDSTWALVHPDGPETPLDLGKVTELLSELTALEPVSTLQQTADLKTLGLEPARYTISIISNGNQQTTPYTLQIGDPTPTDSGYYVHVSDKIVILHKDSIDRITALSSAGALAVSTPTPAITGAPTGAAGLATAVPTP